MTKQQETWTKNRLSIFKKYRDHTITMQDCLYLLNGTHISYSEGHATLWKGKNSIKQKEAAKKLAKFGFSDMPHSTGELVDAVFNHVISDRKLLFAIVCYCVENHTRQRTENRLFLSKITNWFRAALDELGVQYLHTSKELRVTKGSFFVDGRWIHIG